MTITIIIIIVVLILMTIAIFFLLRNAVKNVNKEAKVYFTLKTQEYTSNEDEIEKDKEETKKEEKLQEKTESEQKQESTVVYVEENKDYEVEGLLEIVKKIDNKFALEYEKIIRKFIAEKTNNADLNQYINLKRMKDYIENIGIYNLITIENEKREQKMLTELRLIDEDILNRYILGRQQFNVEEFMNYLDYEMSKCDPTIYVLVGDKNKDYSNIDKRIKTIYTDKIYKGIKIIYKSKMYDYSLS